MDDLKDCPFCGFGNAELKTHAEAYEYSVPENSGWWMAVCPRCGSMSGSASQYTGAREKWNERIECEPSVQKVSEKITIIKE